MKMDADEEVRELQVKLDADDPGTMNVTFDGESGPFEAVLLQDSETDEFTMETDGRNSQDNYNLLFSKPSINGVILAGDLTCDDIEVQPKMDSIQPSDIDALLYGN